MDWRALALAALICTVGTAPAWAGGSGWQTDLDKAFKKADKAGKLLLVEFTDGESSKALNKKVFHTGKFKTWARKRVILVEINFSKRVSKKLAAQYAKAKEKYEVEDYPTVLIINSQGESAGEIVDTDEKDGADWLIEANNLLEIAGGGGKWFTDWEKAKKLSQKSKKPMLVDFNGSDW